MIEDQIAIHMHEWYRIIEEEGGQPIGIQQSIGSDFDAEPYVLFTLKGSSTPLALSVSKLTREAVREKLGKKVPKFQKTELDREKFVETVRAILTRAMDEIEEEMKNAEK